MAVGARRLESMACKTGTQIEPRVVTVASLSVLGKGLV